MNGHRRTPSTWLENIHVGVGALRIHPLRTALSVLGILIGSAALIATMAVSDGMMSFAREQVLRSTSVQVITISPRTSVYEDGEWVPVHDYPIFTTADASALRELIPSVETVTLTLGGRADVSLRGARCRASVVLGTAGLGDFQSIDLAAGRFFSEPSMRVYLIGQDGTPDLLIAHAGVEEGSALGCDLSAALGLPYVDSASPY